MIPDVSQALSWLEAHPKILKGIRRGIERETLRVTPNAHLAMTIHPKVLGSPLTHPWITTDFSESLLEFITPADQNIQTSLMFLRDLHRYTARQLKNELFWPLSMPCFIKTAEDIPLAQYGSSNLGRFKTLYREGLKNRYGALMQIICGVHYNFSLPLAFWQTKEGIEDEKKGKNVISDGYLRLVRNYYRFGWVIPYLFGGSPTVCSSFLREKKSSLAFKTFGKNTLYLPYATSLRLSGLGYTSIAQSNLKMNFNDLHMYVNDLKRATRIPSKEYARIGLKNKNRYLQLNTNLLQIENELYAPIRPKRSTKIGELPSDALLKGGIEYLEIRSLDINPFSPIGINETQIRFLDLFLIWCILAPSNKMSDDELLYTQNNWKRVILEGRKPDQVLNIGTKRNAQSIKRIGKTLFQGFTRIAEIIDEKDKRYQKACDELLMYFEDPNLTFSSRFLKEIQENQGESIGLERAKEYFEQLQKEPLELLTEAQLCDEFSSSWQRQAELERVDTMSFEEYLRLHSCRYC
ncbi:glutamate--cysteine ligase [Candidatus Williamhamiltonella defendens]|uniref:glutamate--cysteine ligase n=1 Tax=Candidatus Williamhamiltonella defendens TaxID=138072 RepID=UPI00130DF083|nr:glutamate--cysteine ligase [Candidatus Hamiltonella defensa]